ncbi:SOS response-associated peptidase [Paenibacillus sp. UNC451MF]|uniref:SOS response-associated peptidase n=1 Tax=Paenibacillus sp. UNC451MF TaxID=1449063 RepID=UPI00048B0FEB|nr:SOS response-associated peptidase family protein [Paenibacillus sp. UNC451MF]
MCDQYTLTADLSELNDRYNITRTMFYYANQRSMLPKQPIAAITVKNQERTLDEFRWGLMPFWAQDSIHADYQTIFEKRAFDHLLKRQRCIIPGSSFDKITPLDQKQQKINRYIVQDGRTFAMAGVYDVWCGSFGEELRTCSILTRKIRNESTGLEEVVPLILDVEQTDTWLDTDLFDKHALYQWMRTLDAPKLRELPAAWWDRADSWDPEEEGIASPSIV